MKVLKKNPLFDPRCCTYRLGVDIRDQVEKLIASEHVEKDTKSTLEDLMDEDETNKNNLAYDSLVKLHKYIARADEDYTDPFYKFIDKCKCIEPKPRDNKELDARLKVLRLRSSQKMYNNISASVDRVFEEKVQKAADGYSNGSLSSNIYSTSNNTDCQNDMSEFKKLNGSVVAVFNSFLVFICTFIFFYKALEYALPQPNIIAQVLFGIGGSTVVAIAELYFLVRVI